MASATVTITITDTASNSLVQIRDGLLIRWNYLTGGGINWTPLGTAQDKLNFIQAYSAKRWFKAEYKAYLDAVAYAAAVDPDVDIQ